MFLLTKANLKLYDGNMGHDQVIGIVLCYLTKCPSIYTSGPVYLCLDHPSNTISLGDLKFMFVLKMLIMNLLTL